MNMPDHSHQRARLSRPPQATQRGVALAVALILLVVITLVGLASVSGTILQNKAASNQYDRQIAYQAAAGALRAGEKAVVTATQNDNTETYRDCSDAGTRCWANPFDNPNAAIINVSTTAYNAGSHAAMQPQYVIQKLGKFAVTLTPQGGTSAPVHTYAIFYRITARSGDPADVGTRSVVTLQSTFRD